MAELLYRGPVTGLSLHNYGRYVDCLGVGTRVYLSTVDNPHDCHAVGVFYRRDNGAFEQIGWVPKGRNLDVFRFLEDEIEYWPAIITNHDREKSFDSSLFIQVYDSSTAAVKKPAPTPPKSLSTKETKMELNLNSFISSNKEAAKSAAYMEAGRMANDKAAQVLSKKAPMMVRGYVDTPVGKVVISNLAAMALEQLRPGDKRAATLAKAMQVQAYSELIRTVDLEGMLDEILNNVTVKKALKTLDKATDSE